MKFDVTFNCSSEHEYPDGVLEIIFSTAASFVECKTDNDISIGTIGFTVFDSECGGCSCCDT